MREYKVCFIFMNYIGLHVLLNWLFLTFPHSHSEMGKSYGFVQVIFDNKSDRTDLQYNRGDGYHFQ